MTADTTITQMSKNAGGWIRACEGSFSTAQVEVLVSPARPRTLKAANYSLPSHGAGFLAVP